MLKYVFFLFIFTLNILFAENIQWKNITNINAVYYGGNYVGISKMDSLNVVALIDIEIDGNTGEGPFRQILKSTDGGLSWATLYFDSVITWHKSQNIFYLNKNNIIVACDENFILKTSDGGLNWEEIYINMPSYLGIVYISMFDSLHGLVSNYTNIAYTEDCFKTYKIIHIPGNNMMIGAIKVISPFTIYLLSDDPIGFLQYNIKSNTWIVDTNCFPVYDLPYSVANDMFFQDSLNGIVVGQRHANIANTSYDMIHKTTDGGRTWEEVLNTYRERKFGLFYTDFCDSENGIAVGQGGKVYWTHDGGNSWIQDSSYVIFKECSAVSHVTLLDKYTAIIADFEGNIFRSSLPTDVPEEKKDEKCYQCNFESSNLVIINENLEKSSVRVEIYDLLGNLLNQTTKISNSNTLKIDINSLISIKGVYVYRVYLNDIIYCTGKYIK